MQKAVRFKNTFDKSGSKRAVKSRKPLHNNNLIPLLLFERYKLRNTQNHSDTHTSMRLQKKPISFRALNHL